MEMIRVSIVVFDSRKSYSERPYRADHQFPLDIQGKDRGDDCWTGRHPLG